MKTTRSFTVLRAVSFSGLTLGCLLLPTPLAANAVESTPDNQSDLSVFMGISIGIERDSGVCPIQGISQKAAEVVEGGQVTSVPLNQLNKLRARSEPKVARTGVTIAELNEEKFYSPGADPVVKGMVQQAQIGLFIMERVDAAANEVRLASTQNLVNDTPGAPPAGQPGQGWVSDSFNNLSTAVMDSQSDFFGTTHSVDRARDEAEKGVFDALSTVFRISSDKRIENAYVARVSFVRIPTDPDTPIYTMCVKSVPVIDQSPTRVEILQYGLPAGFEVERSEIHVFAGTDELVTNLSKGRVAVNPAEAFDFLLVQHLLNHKEDDLPPQVAHALLPESNVISIPTDQSGRVANVTVDKDGRVQDCSLARWTSAEHDAAIESLIRNTRFFPALTDGSPVPGIATVTLAEFSR